MRITALSGVTGSPLVSEGRQEPAVALRPVHLPTAPRRVLVIDDEPMLCELLSKILSARHQVTACTSAREALALVLAGERFDRILCDLMMPEMNGMGLHAALLRAAPDQAARMVFLTGGAFTTELRSFLRAIPNLQVLKPFNAHEIFALVERSPAQDASIT